MKLLESYGRFEELVYFANMKEQYEFVVRHYIQHWRCSRNLQFQLSFRVEENTFGTAPLRAPKWYKCPVGASFRFGGKLVSFHAKPPPKGASSIPSEVFLHSLVTEQSLFAQGEQWNSLCDVLASKVMAAGNTLAAVLCYICAGNVDRTVEICSRSLANERDGRSYAELLQDLMEKTLVLALATGNKKFSASLCKIFECYAEILASQGLLTTAMKYLKVLDSGGLSPERSILRDRISLSRLTLQPSYPPASASNAQPSMRTTYVPSTPPALKNADQYQQAAPNHWFSFIHRTIEQCIPCPIRSRFICTFWPFTSWAIS